MRLYEVNKELSEMIPTGGTVSSSPAQGQELKVDSQDAKQTTLIDPKTKVKTVVPNDPKKPGMIQKDQAGKAHLLAKPQGPVQQVKPGDTVTVK